VGRPRTVFAFYVCSSIDRDVLDTSTDHGDQVMSLMKACECKL